MITASEELYENQLLVWLLLIVMLLNLLLMVSMKETVDQAGASLSHTSGLPPQQQEKAIVYFWSEKQNFIE